MNHTPIYPDLVDTIAHRAADKADAAIGSMRQVTDTALDTLQDKADQLAGVAPGTLSRIAAQSDELTRRSIERAREASEVAKDQAARAGDRTVGYIRDEPVKSVLIAVAAGAAIAALIGALARTRQVVRD